jgi:hypothetical protein
MGSALSMGSVFHISSWGRYRWGSAKRSVPCFRFPSHSQFAGPLSGRPSVRIESTPNRPLPSRVAQSSQHPWPRAVQSAKTGQGRGIAPAAVGLSGPCVVAVGGHLVSRS